jgi:cellulose synthase/poly-beta-1,6-N-acetylglucosamine synthase-like glycosyltransferase
MMYNRYQFKKRKLALVIPAHNEEIVIADTIHSAITAGQHPADIFVVADGCNDQTVEIAVRLLGAKNVLDQPQSGKAKAILHAIDYFEIKAKYDWLHIADADGVFDSRYFAELQARLSKKHVAATGHIQSLKGGLVSQYRTYEYAFGLEVLRRIQTFFGVIPVIPGPTSVFRTDIIDQLDFTVDALTEDMDITLQIHRQKLGSISYIPQAKTFTQDPKDLGDYTKQVSRWYRGTFQVMHRHNIGFRPHKIDAYMGYVMLEQWLTIAGLLIIPFMAWWSQNYAPLAIMFLSDVMIFFSITVWASGLTRRPDVVGAFPMFYLLRFLNLFIFVRSWYEIVVQRKFRTAQVGWSTAGRRYRIVTDAVTN